MDRLKRQFAGVTLVDGIFLFAALSFSCWLMWHSFSYDSAKGTFSVTPMNWGDFLIHIPMIRSFSLGHNWPVEYPFFPGEPCRYHYLFFAGVGFLEWIGLRLDWALNLPSALSFFALLAGIYGLAFFVYRSRRVAILSALFFLFNGSFALFTYAGGRPDSSKLFFEIWSSTNWIAHGPYNGSEIAHFWTLNPYINQRHLAFALAFVLFLHWLTLWVETRSARTQRIAGAATGMVAGLFPLYHQPGLLMLAITGAVFLVTVKGSRNFLLSFALATVIVAAALFPLLSGLIGKTAAAPQFRPGYLMKGSFTPWNVARYWLINLGAHFFFIPLGIWLSTPAQRKVYLPTFFIFAVAFLVQFGVAPELNHKFFNFCIIVAQMASAYALVSIADEGLKAWRNQRGKLAVALPWGVFAVGTFLCVASGLADLMPLIHMPPYPVVDYSHHETAQWIKRHTPKRAVFLTSRPDLPAPTLVGRPILMSHSMFVLSLGYDYNRRRDLAVTVWKGMNVGSVCAALKELNAEYLLYEEGTKHPDVPTQNIDFFRQRLAPAFRSADRLSEIYSVKDLCAARPNHD